MNTLPNQMINIVGYPQMNLTRFLRLVVAISLLPVARADDWPAPVIREIFSPSRAYFVRVIPGKDIGDSVGFRGAAKGPFARAEFYRQEKDQSYRQAATARLLNPVAPVEFFVTNTGFLITVDNWHNVGYGKVVAIYEPEGKLARAFELSDLFTQSEIEGFSHSESSIRWHESTGTYVRLDGETLNITVNAKGAGFIFQPNGAYQYCETRARKFSCRTANHGPWRPFREPGGSRCKRRHELNTGFGTERENFCGWKGK